MGGEFRIKLSDLTWRLLGGYLAIVALLIVIILVADYNMARTQKAIQAYSSQYVPQLNVAGKIQTIVQEQQTLTRDFTAGNKNVKQRYRQLDRLFNAEIREMMALKPDAETLKSLLQVQREHANFNLVANHIFKYEETRRQDLVDTLWKNYTLTGNKMIHTTAHLVDDSNTKVRVGEKQSKEALITSRKIMYTLFLVTLILCGVLTVRSSRGITGPLFKIVSVSQLIAAGDLTQRVEENSIGEFHQLAQSFNTMVVTLEEIIKKVVGSIQQIAAACEVMQTHTQESAATLEVINTSMSEVSGGATKQFVGIGELRASASLTAEALNNISRSIQKIDEITKLAADGAGDGGASVKNAIVRMSEVENKVQRITQDIKALAADISRISCIIDSISGFAKQTNLLALNAAIEAARAGENGRGFAVVADSVRKLANESTALAEQIKKIILGIQQRSKEAVTSIEEGRRVVENGVLVINEAGGSLNQIIEAVQTASVQTQQVFNNVLQITRGSETNALEITATEEGAQQAMSSARHVLEMVDTQSKAVSQLSEHAVSLNKMANQLQQAVSGFKIS